MFQFENEEAAERLVKNLDRTTWPKGGKQLQVKFVDEAKVIAAIEKDEAEEAPKKVRQHS